MKVFNLTDVETDELKRRHLVNKTVVVDRYVIEPGKSMEVPDSASTRATMKHLLDVGALAIDTLPPAYAAQKPQTAIPQRISPSLSRLSVADLASPRDELSIREEPSEDQEHRSKKRRK